MNPRPQIFSFRWPIIKYILKNPNGKTWKKLIKTCTYFFAKYPVYPVENFQNHGQWDVDGKIIDINKGIPKIWLFDTFYCWNNFVESKIFSDLVSKIIKCDLRVLYISHQALTWEQYELLTSSSSLKKIFFVECSFKYFDGSDFTVDKFLERFQNIEEFEFVCKLGSKMFKNETVKKMVEILSGLENMCYFDLSNLDETFDLSSFMDFILTNFETISVGLQYSFGLQFSDTYKQMLETCFEKLVANPITKNFPNIWIPHFDGLQYLEYRKIRNSRYWG